MLINKLPDIWWEFCINPYIVSETDLNRVNLDNDLFSEEWINEETYYAKKYIIQRLKKILESRKSNIDISKISTTKAKNIVLNNIKTSYKIEDILLMKTIKILELEKRSIEYKEKSITDKLTWLKNRRFIETEILKAIELNKRQWLISYLLIIDIDNFKNINDTFGHIKWDELLIALSEFFKKDLRSTDTYWRWGWEEFIVLINNVDKKIIEDIAEKLRKWITEHLQKSIGFTNKKITVSIWWSEIKPDDDINNSIKRSDNALYLCKNNWRNCTKILNQKDFENNCWKIDIDCINCSDIKECKI